MELLSDLMQTLLNCSAACERCVNGCLNDGQAMSCCKLCRDCADVCRLCFTLQARQSHYLNGFLQLCAEMCEACAEECDKHAMMYEHCKVCASACRDCAAACKGNALNTDQLKGS